VIFIQGLESTFVNHPTNSRAGLHPARIRAIIIGIVLLSFSGLHQIIHASPVVLNTNLEMRLIINTVDSSGAYSVRIARNPFDGQLYYLKINGDIYRLKLWGGTNSTSVKVYSAADHGLSSSVMGMAFGPDGTLYVVGNTATNGGTSNIGQIMKGVPLAGGARAWSCLASTEAYPRSLVSDHLMNAILVSADGSYIYVNSGARTDHGEIESANGLYPNLRETDLTGKLLRLPATASNLVLSNRIDWLRGQGYVFAEGLRNAFDLAFAPNGDLFATDNGPDRDMSDELNWVQAGMHYGFPWRMGGQDNPQQFPNYDPTADRLLDPRLTNYQNDPTFPPSPGGFSEPVINLGPDACSYRDPLDGSLHIASASGQTLSTFTAHRSPLGLVFDTASAMAPPFQQHGFMLSWTVGDPTGDTVFGPFLDPSQDLVDLNLLKLGNTNYQAQVTRIVGGFDHPVDAEIIENKIYVLEQDGNQGIWEITFPSAWGMPSAPTPLSGAINGLHFGNSQTGNSHPENLPAEFSAMGASQTDVEPYLGHGTSLDMTIQLPSPNGMTAQEEIQGRTWTYIAMQPGAWNGYLYGQSNLDAAIQIIGWAEAVGQHPNYYIYQAWPSYSPVNGWGQVGPAGPWPVYSTYSDVWNRPTSTFTTSQFETNGPVPNYLNVYFDIFMGKLRAAFPQETVNIIPVGEVFAQLDALLLASNGIPTNGPTSVTGAWSFISQDYGDGIHANPLGQYVAHATTLSTITGVKPQNLPIDISTYAGLTADEKSFLDGVIWNVLTSDLRTGVPGKIGALVYFLPNTGDGLIPTQSWDAVGSTPSGDVYVSGMDHVTNAALYRFRPSTGTLEYVGDARAASEAANNWLPGEAVQKFHTRPLWYKGRVYVATLNWSNLTDDYLNARSFKWYTYDEGANKFADLSAAAPGGTALTTNLGGIVSPAVPAAGQPFYAMTIPTAEIVAYDPLTNVTTRVGRPEQFNKPYVYSARFMWVDSLGRLYLSAGNPFWSPQTGTRDDPAVFNHMYDYDPGQGFGELTNWTLVNTTAIQSGQWTLDRQNCYMMDDQGNVFVFNDAQRSFTWLSKIPLQALASWVFQLSANGKKIYVVEGQHDSAGRLFEFDIQTGSSRVLCSLADLVPSVTRGDVCGYNSWDNNGCFYITSGDGLTNVALIQIDPVLVKAGFGFLPSLTTVQLVPSLSDPGSFCIVRTGDTNHPCSVVYSARVPYDPAIATQFYSATIPPGQTNLELPFPNLVTNPAAPQIVTVALLPDGDTYKAGTNRSETWSFDSVPGPELPSLGLQQPAGTALTNGGSADYGAVLAGNSAELTFTITNSGDAELSGLALWLDGPDACAFALSTNSLSPVPESGGTASFTVRFSPRSAGGKTAVLYFISNDPESGLWMVHLTGTGTASALVVEQPPGNPLANGHGSTDFGAIQQGGSTNLTFVAKNVGSSALNLSNLVIFGADASAFTIVTEPASIIAAPAGSTSFTIRFSPPSFGTKTATLSLPNDDPLHNPFYINITGSMAAPVIVIRGPDGTSLTNGSMVDFGVVPTGGSGNFVVTITNTGTTALTLLNLAIDGPDSSAFAVTGISNSNVAASASTSFIVQFLPQSAGSKTATLHLLSNDPFNGSFTLSLSGTEVVLALAVEELLGTPLPNGSTCGFGSVDVGGSTNLTFTLRNTGTASLTSLSLTIDGPAASEFTIISNPASSLLPGDTTSFVVGFTPATIGVRSATLHLASNVLVPNPFNLNLTGSGVAPLLAVEQPPGVSLTNGDTRNLGTVALGATNDLTFTLRNIGSSDLSVSNVMITGTDFQIVPPVLAGVVAPGSSGSVTVSFIPSSAGPKIGTLRIASNDPVKSSFLVNLLGAGSGSGPSGDSAVDAPLMSVPQLMLLLGLFAGIGCWANAKRRRPQHG
jgi:hypothetical protein